MANSFEIRFALGLCSLGSILVAMSPRGVCAISLGDAPETLIREVQDRFPRGATLRDAFPFCPKADPRWPVGGCGADPSE